MLMIIVCLRGQRYEMSFLPGEQKAAEQIAKRYGTTVYQPGALMDCGELLAVRERCATFRKDNHPPAAFTFLAKRCGSSAPLWLGGGVEKAQLVALDGDSFRSIGIRSPLALG